MIVARRVYLYVIAYAALVMFSSGLIGLIQIWLDWLARSLAGAEAVSLSIRGSISLFGALALIGLPTWLAHWWLSQRAAVRNESGERTSAIRALFLYFTLFFGAVTIFTCVWMVLRLVLRFVLDTQNGRRATLLEMPWPLAILLVTALFWWYYRRVLLEDRSFAAETGARCTLRRWLIYGLALIGLLAALNSEQALIEQVWETVTTRFSNGKWVLAGGFQTLASQVAGLTTGTALWFLAWGASSTWMRGSADLDAEERSVLRKVYLYVALFVAVSWTVWAAGGVLYWLLRLTVIPREAAGESLLDDLGSAIATVAAFGLSWLYHARVIRQEAARSAEWGGQASIRWTYGYLVAFIGLCAFAGGLAGALSTVLDTLVQRATVSGTTWPLDRLCLLATLMLVGGPVWLIPWRPLMAEATDARAARSLSRRIYLFLTFAGSVLSILGAGAYGAYQLLRLMLGEQWTVRQTTDAIVALSIVGVAALFLAYHLRVYLADGRARAAATPAEPPRTFETTLTLIAPTQALIEAARESLTAALPTGVEADWGETRSRT